jgi:stearoyl-CoA desaturase (delta-9 desaturase)
VLENQSSSSSTLEPSIRIRRRRPAWGGVESLPFWLVHVVAVVGVVWLGWSWKGLLLALALYAIRMFAITAGYHRYFAHRSYRASRPVQFALAALGTTAAQQGPLWWAAHHRRHHRFSDQPEDVHSVRQRGFWYAHLGWVFASENQETRLGDIPDLARYPELRWLNRHHLVPVVILAALLLAVGGPFALVWGFFVSTTLLWHGTFSINSLSHVFGRRRYATSDDSRNSLALALITLGEGWHNNHHYYQRAASQGFYWWEIDVSYYVLRLLSLVGLVRDVGRPPRHVRDQRPALDSAVDFLAPRAGALR